MKSFSIKRNVAFVTAVLVLILSGCQKELTDDLESRSTQPDIFNEIAESPQMREMQSHLIDEEATLRKRYVTFDSTQMLNAVTSENQVRLNLFEDYELVARTEKLDLRKGVHSWTGTVDGAEYSYINLSFVEDHIMGMVHVDDIMFAIQPLGDGRHVIAEVVQSNFLDGNCEKIIESDHSEEHGHEPHSTNKVTSNVLKVMLVIPNDGMKIFCSNSFMKNLLEVQAENSLNNAFNTDYYTTGFSANVQIVCSSYKPTKDPDTDLDWLSNDVSISVMRNITNSDLVCMFVDKLNNACGYGETPSNVSSSTSNACHTLVKYSCAFGYYTFPHEIGHNLGMYHDRYVETGNDNQAGRCGYGYVYNWSGGKGRSIMAYPDWCEDNGKTCKKRGRYSFGLFQFGKMCGLNSTALSGSASNLSQLHDAFPYVTAYR